MKWKIVECILQMQSGFFVFLEKWTKLNDLIFYIETLVNQKWKISD